MQPEEPSNAETQFVELSGGVAAYTDVGAGPVLVCVHGMPGSIFDFRWLEPAWADDDKIVESRVSKILTKIAPARPRLHFDTGGHNIQKTRATEIAQMLCPWMQENPNHYAGGG